MIDGTFDASGRLSVDGVGAIASWACGDGYTATGALAVAIDGTPAYDDQGMFYNSGHRVCVASVAAIASYANGLPFTATGLLAVSAGGTVAYYNQGAGFDAAGRLVTT